MLKNIKPLRGGLLNKTHPHANGLVGCWIFNEQAGPMVGDQLQRNNSPISGTEGTTYIWRNNGLYLNATDVTYIEAPDNEPFKFGSGNFTFITKFTKLEASSGWTNTFYISMYQAGAGDDNSWTLALTAGGSDDLPTFSIRLSGADQTVGTGSVTIGVPATVGISRIGSNMRSYLNGIYQNINSSAGGAILDSGNKPVVIGADSGYGAATATEVEIDYIYIYNRGMTADEIADITTNPFSMFMVPGLPKFVTFTVGTWCWGHDTGVTEDNTGNLVDGTYTATLINSASLDDEAICITSGQYWISPHENVGEGIIKITYDQYNEGSGTPGIIEYRKGSTASLCIVATWTTYSTPFDNTGSPWVQTRFRVA